MISKIEAFKEFLGFFLQSFKLIKMNMWLCIMLSTLCGSISSILSIYLPDYPIIELLVSVLMYHYLYFYFFKNAKGVSEKVMIQNIWPLIKVRILVMLYILWKVILWTIIPAAIAKIVSYIPDDFSWGYMLLMSTMIIIVLLPGVIVSVIYIYRFMLVDYFVLFQNASFKEATNSSNALMNGYKFAVFLSSVILFAIVCAVVFAITPVDSDLSIFYVIYVIKHIGIISFVVRTIEYFVILLSHSTFYLLWNSKKDTAVIDPI